MHIAHFEYVKPVQYFNWIFPVESASTSIYSHMVDFFSIFESFANKMEDE